VWHWINGVPTFNGTINLAALTTTGSITVAGNINPGTGSQINWSGRTHVLVPADGQFNLTTAAESAGVGLDVTSDAVLMLRTRAQSAYATLDVLGLKASGVAGATGTFANVTVVNGIVTSGT